MCEIGLISYYSLLNPPKLDKVAVRGYDRSQIRTICSQATDAYRQHISPVMSAFSSSGHHLDWSLPDVESTTIVFPRSTPLLDWEQADPNIMFKKQLHAGELIVDVVL